MQLKWIAILLLLQGRLPAQEIAEIVFQNKITGEIQRIRQGDFIKIYALNAQDKSYSISGRLRSFDGNSLVLKSNKSVPLVKIQRLKHMSNGRRNGIIFAVAGMVLILFVVISVLSFYLAIAPASLRENSARSFATILLPLVAPLIIIGIIRFANHLGYAVMEQFQSNWTMLVEQSP